MWRKKNKCKYKVGDRVTVKEPFGIAMLYFSGYVIGIDSTEKNWWQQKEPSYTIKKVDGGVQRYVQESSMTLIESSNENELAQYGFDDPKNFCHMATDRHVRAAYDMIQWLSSDFELDEEVKEIESAANGWLVLSMRVAGVEDNVINKVLNGTRCWSFYVLSRDEATEYYKMFQRELKEEELL